jgi:signal transduction histidine kinase
VAEIADRLNAIRQRITLPFASKRRGWLDRVGGLVAFAMPNRRSAAPLQTWQILAGGLSILIPALIITVFGDSLPLSTPGVIFLFAVALLTYVAGWTGGITALVIATIWLDLLFVGDRKGFNWPKSLSEGLTLAMIVGVGTAVILLIEQVKREGEIGRREAIAARAATAAISTLEASSRSDGEIVSEEQAMRLLLNAMLRANRAHGGIVLLYDVTRQDFMRIAHYGVNDMGRGLPDRFPAEQGFAGRIGLERRPAMVERVSRSALVDDPVLSHLGFESALGVPLVADDTLIGIAITGLLLPHKFNATEAARAEAIGSRAAALLRAARAGDARAIQLQRAQDARDRLNEVLQTMPEAVMLAAPPDGRILSYNAAAVRMFGTIDTVGPLSDLSNRLLTPDGLPADPATLPHIVALRSGDMIDSVELLVRLGDGRETPVLASAAPLRELDQTIAAVIVVFRDIRALKDAAKLKDEFVSVVSHELRSPMTPIRGFVQLVTRDLIREGHHDQQVKWLQSISGHVDRMTRLVDDLLEVSRLKSGTLDIRLEPTNIAAVCEDVATSRQASAPAHTVLFSYNGGAIVGAWDHDRLHQIVDNLVGNAIKYSPAGGTVTIDLSADWTRKAIRLTVTDEGPGIPETDRDRIFSAFYRTHEATISQISGLGLGLYIVSELVAAHGGTIDVGEGLTGGAAFTVNLPLMQAATAAD